MSEQIRILTSSSITVGRVASVLEENNIPTRVIDNTESARLAGFGATQNDVDLFINQSDLKVAQKILETISQDF